MVWKVPKIWDGGDVWIIGGGPSITRQFDIPEEIVQGVLSKQLSLNSYSPFMKCIHDKHVIGVNMAYQLGSWIDFVFFGDIGFLLSNENELKKFPNIVISCAVQAESYSWIKYVEKDKNHRQGISTENGKVSWNHNSGAAAINLAVHTGAKRIFLLGFDMKIQEGYRHWHNAYNYGKIDDNTKKYKNTLKILARHLSGFPFIASDAKKLGIEIYNVCPDSAINEFPKITLKEAMNLIKKKP